MGKLTRHMAKAIQIEVENDVGEKDILSIKPLPFKYMPEFYELMKVVGKLTEAQGFDESEEDTPEEQAKRGMDLINTLSKEDFQKIQLIIDKTVEVSFPDENENTRSGFASKHFFVLLNAVMEVNSSGKSKGKSQ